MMIKNFEEFLNEDSGSIEYAVVLVGGSIGDKPRPRNANGYIGMDAGKEALYPLDKAKEKAKRMNNILTPGEKSHYGLKYVVVPVKGNKFFESGSSDSVNEGSKWFNKSKYNGPGNI